MKKMSATELTRDFDRVEALALSEPIAIGKGRNQVVLLSVDEYKRLKRRDRRVMSLDDFTEEDIEAIERAEPPPECARFDDEV